MASVTLTTRSTVVELDSSTALLTPELSRNRGLSFPDSVIYASARKYKSELVTSDDHFEGLSGVVYFPKKEG